MAKEDCKIISQCSINMVKLGIDKGSKLASKGFKAENLKIL